MSELVADALLNDPSYQKAKKSILNTIEKHKKKITSIRSAQSDLKMDYEQMIQLIGDLRSLALFYPYLGSGFGNGALVELADGSVKYDFISGIGTHFGHSHPTIIEAGLDAAIQNVAMQGNLQQNRDSLDLTELLIKESKLDHCILSTSGAIANENALKILFQYKAPSHRIIAFENCFMGRTLSLSQITDRPGFREGLPHNLHVDYIPFYDWRDPKGSTERSLNAMQTLMSRHPGAYACMCFELIQGEAGSYPGKYEFFIALIKLLKEHNIPIFVDEVQSFGRTDYLFAFQHFGLQEHVDIVTCGKLLHTCATLFRTEFRPKPGLISQTYTAASSSIRVATAILKSLTEEGYLGLSGKNMQIRRRIVEHLQDLANKYPDKIEGPFGHGLMIAFTPFNGVKEKVIAFAKALFEAGVISFISGTSPTRIRFLVPAGGITDEAIDQVAGIIEETLKKLF